MPRSSQPRRGARPDDLYRLRIPTDPAISLDGRLVAFTLQSVAPSGDAYRHEVWAVPADGSEPAWRLAGTGDHDRHARFSPDGRWLAFLSDRKASHAADANGPAGATAAPAIHDGGHAPGGDESDGDDECDGGEPAATQLHLLPLRGGEARRLTSLARGVDDFEWSPDGRWLAVIAAVGPPPRRRQEGEPPASDYRHIDRLQYMLNGEGFLHDRVVELWVVHAETGAARRVTKGRSDASAPAWSPDGTRIAFAADRSDDFDLRERSDVIVVDVATGREVVITGGERAAFRAPRWLPDGRTVATIGHRFPVGGGSRADLWLFAADGSEAGPDAGRNVTGPTDLMLGAGVASDLTPGEPARLHVSADGGAVSFIAPDRGSAQLWRVTLADGQVERLTEGRHHISAFAGADPDGRGRFALIRSDPTHPSEVGVLDGGEPRILTTFNAEVLADLELIEPVERWTSVDGRQIQGWYYPPLGESRGGDAPPLVAQIHGGPHAYYAWSPMWEFQVLGGAGIAVYASNPRGSEGYGQEFNAANYRDWADGPMRDVLGGVDALIAEGLADPARLGVTGGSYGGYLTIWIVAHDHRFRAALTARSVSDVAMLMLTGDISGADFGIQEFGVAPWDDPDYYRAISPLTYARNIRTPLLIQHSERDIRTTVGQAEALFTVLRSLKRPVRFMRVPDENHELTRSGTPFRRVENLVQVRDWFTHFLVKRRRAMPPVPQAGPAAATRSGARRRGRKAHGAPRAPAG